MIFYTYQGVSIFLLGIVIFILIFLTLLVGFIYFRDIPEIKDILRKGLGLVEREESRSSSTTKVYPYCRWIKLVDIKKEYCHWTFYLRCKQGLMLAEGCLDKCYRYEELPKTPSGAGLITGAGLGALAGGLLLGIGGAIIGGILGGLIGNAQEIQNIPKPETEFSRGLKECKRSGCSYSFVVKI